MPMTLKETVAKSLQTFCWTQKPEGSWHASTEKDYMIDGKVRDRLPVIPYLATEVISILKGLGKYKSENSLLMEKDPAPPRVH